jgi:hypothetical protein
MLIINELFNLNGISNKERLNPQRNAETATTNNTYPLVSETSV